MRGESTMPLIVLTSLYWAYSTFLFYFDFEHKPIIVWVWTYNVRDHQHKCVQRPWPQTHTRHVRHLRYQGSDTKLIVPYSYHEFVHHFDRSVVGQVPVLVQIFLQKLLELHLLRPGLQQFFLHHDVNIDFTISEMISWYTTHSRVKIILQRNL